MLLYRLISDNTEITLDDKIYSLLYPSPEIRLKSYSIYEQAAYKLRYDNILRQSDCLKILVSQDLCSFDIDKNLEEISKQIENLKCNLFNSLMNPASFKKTRNTLDLVKKKYTEQINIRHSLDYLTIEGFAEMVRQQYIVMETLYHNEEKVWDSIDDVDFSLLERIMAKKIEYSISIEDIRDIARNDPWKTYWSINKGNPFPQNKSFVLSEEQKSLILFSRMYDSAYEHPDCPNDSVIQDDDLFDGWMVFIRRENESRKKEQEFEKNNKKLAKADEIYIMANSKEEAEQIDNMNSVAGKIIKKQREKVLETKGKAIDANFEDRKMQISAAKQLKIKN